MNIVVFDLETTPNDGGQEIIEIGAVRLINGEIIDTFQVYVFPTSNGGYIPKRTRKFIGIKRQQIETALNLDIAINNFVEWIGTADYFCAWGLGDQDIVIKNCQRNNIPYNWLHQYVDIQNQISYHVFKENRQISLEDAVVLSNIETDKRFHQALNDAMYTTQLVQKYYNTLQFEGVTTYSHGMWGSCPLYITCKRCTKEKFFTDFMFANKQGKRQKLCYECWESKKLE